MGHSPYRQWYVYRRRRLFILTSAAEELSFPLGQTLAQVLATYLPESQAMAARARDAVEMVKLLGSRQLDVALLQIDDAHDASQGKGKFQEEDPVPLRVLAIFGSYLFVCRDDFSRQKAYQIAKTLTEHQSELKSIGFQGAPSGLLEKDPHDLPLHPGARDFYEGRPLPLELEEERP